MEDRDTKIGNIMKKWRFEEHLTGQEVADSIGVTQSFVNFIENGKKKMSKKVFKNLMKIMSEKRKDELEEEYYLSEIPQRVLNKINGVIQAQQIPYFSEVRASAGYGCLNEDECKEFINVPVQYFRKGNIAINVDGDSMSPKLETGDIIVVDTKDTEFCENKIVVVNYNDDIYVKKLVTGERGLQLISTNPFYPPIKIGAEEEINVIGKVVFSFREY